MNEQLNIAWKHAAAITYWLTTVLKKHHKPVLVFLGKNSSSITILRMLKLQSLYQFSKINKKYFDTTNCPNSSHSICYSNINFSMYFTISIKNRCVFLGRCVFFLKHPPNDSEWPIKSLHYFLSFLLPPSSFFFSSRVSMESLCV